MSKQASILVVDDESEILQTFRRRLRLEDFDVELANGPSEALEKMRDTLFPIVISDIKMPGMSGIELLSELKRINPLCNVIMITGYSSMANVVECLGHGAVDYFVKPFQDLDDVVTAVRQAAERVERWKDSIATKGAN